MDEPGYAMYLVHKPTMLAPDDVVYDEIRVPVAWAPGLDACDIAVDAVDRSLLSASV